MFLHLIWFCRSFLNLSSLWAEKKRTTFKFQNKKQAKVAETEKSIIITQTTPWRYEYINRLVYLSLGLWEQSDCFQEDTLTIWHDPPYEDSDTLNMYSTQREVLTLLKCLCFDPLILPAAPGFSRLSCWSPDETATTGQYSISSLKGSEDCSFLPTTQNQDQHSTKRQVKRSQKETCCLPLDSLYHQNHIYLPK